MTLPSDPSTRRDRRIERKRLEIMNAAARVFARGGYAGATTRDIAQEADIGEGTLYNYFPSKRDILLAIAEHHASGIDAIIQSSPLQDAPSMVDVLDRALEAALSEPLFSRMMITEAWMSDELLQGYLIERLSRLANLVVSRIEGYVQDGKARPIDAKLAARLVVGMALAAIAPALRGTAPPPGPAERHALAETIISILIQGISAHPGSAPREG